MSVHDQPVHDQRVTDWPVTDHAAVMTPGAQLVDVREPVELLDGTLPGAVNVPLSELPRRAVALDPHRRVVLVCRSGGRSRRAAEFLVASGFIDVVNLTGGMDAHERAQRSGAHG